MKSCLCWVTEDNVMFQLVHIHYQSHVYITLMDYGHLKLLATWLIVQQQENITHPHCCPFVRGIHQWLVDSPHKGTVMWKALPCQNILMFGTWPASKYVFMVQWHMWVTAGNLLNTLYAMDNLDHAWLITQVKRIKWDYDQIVCRCSHLHKRF